MDRDKYNRTVAEVLFDTPDGEQSVQEEMLKAGMAYHYKQYSGNCHNRDVFDTAEDIGRSQKLGVWQLSGGGERPWDYRKQKKSWCTPRSGIHQTPKLSVAIARLRRMWQLPVVMKDREITANQSVNSGRKIVVLPSLTVRRSWNKRTVSATCRLFSLPQSLCLFYSQTQVCLSFLLALARRMLALE